MTFFYDLNKKLATIADKPETKQLNERDMSRAAKGYEKYGKQGMEALAKAGREGKALDPVRAKYDKYDNKKDVDESTGDYSAKKARAGKDIGKPGKNFEKIAKSAGEKYGSKERGEKVAGAVLAKLRGKNEGVEEGLGSIVKKIGGGMKKSAGRAMDAIAPGDEALLKDLQKKTGMPQTGKKPQTMALHKSNTVDDNAVVAKEEYGPLEEKPMSPKQKSFAKLAPPADKITFADKIAGAKKEVDEMLGDVAAEAMRGALKGGQKKLDKNHNGKLDSQDFAMLRKGGKQETDEGWDDMMRDVERRRSEVKPGHTVAGHKGDIEKTATGIKHTRRYDPKTGETDSGEETGADGQTAKRGRGRPKGSTGKIGAKGPSGTSKLMTKEAEHDSEEVKQAMAVLKKAGYKVSKGEEELDEKAVSKAQRKAAGIAHAAQKGEIPKSELRGASKEMAKMPKGELHKFAATKEKGLPAKKGKEEVEETTSETPKASKGGMQFGKGIYDSMNRELEKMIAETMNISMSMNNDMNGGPAKSLTVNATDEDAEVLGKLLKMAGVDGHGDHMSGQSTCPTCGSADCGCGDVEEALDENQPEWPTEPVTSDDALQYSGGLNKPKVTGQTTTPVIAGQVDRMRTYENEELDEQEQVMAPEEDLEEAIARMRNLAGIQEAKKDVEEEKTEEGNLFTGNLAKARADGKKEADLDGDGDMEKVRESVSTMWKVYKG